MTIYRKHNMLLVDLKAEFSILVSAAEIISSAPFRGNQENSAVNS